MITSLSDFREDLNSTDRVLVDIPLARLLRDPGIALSIPYSSLITPSGAESGEGELGAEGDEGGEVGGAGEGVKEIYFICKKGNDSFIAARAFRRHLTTSTATPTPTTTTSTTTPLTSSDLAIEENDLVDKSLEERTTEGAGGEEGAEIGREEGLRVRVFDVMGGIIAWSREIDSKIPTY